MIRYSILVPQRNAGNEFARQLPELRRVLDLLALPYEVICIDQASAPPTRAALAELLDRHPFLRVLTLDRATPLEAALAAGVAAARGELVVAIGPGKEYPVQQIPHLIAELARADVVFARRRRVGWAHAWQQLAEWPRQRLWGRMLQKADCLFWAARREAVAGLDATRGTARFLPWLMAMRGYRVAETTVRFQPVRRPLSERWPHPADLLAVWWLGKRRRPAKVDELRPQVAEVALPATAGASRWLDAAQGRGRRDTGIPQRDTA